MATSAPVLSDLQKRVISAVILFPLTIFLLMIGEPYNNWFIATIFFLTLVEWMKLTLKTSFPLSTKSKYFIVGFAYIVIGFAGFWHIDFQKQVAVLGLVVINDIAAFFVGKTVGGAKLAPSISPNKTWSGSIGGFCITLAISGLFLWHIDSAIPLSVMVFIGFLIIVAQLGDLLESWVKRQYGVKDSGSIIPGHGGLLDRLDSLIAVSIIMLLCHLKIININQLVF